MSNLPSMYQLFLPCLSALAKGATNARECLPILEKQFGLTSEQMSEMIPSGKRTRMFDRADWALFHLMKAELVERPRRGFYQLSANGRAYLTSGRVLDWNTLSAMPAYLAWKQQENDKDDGFQKTTAAAFGGQSESAQTPSELIDQAFRQIEVELAEELLSAVLSLTPAQFEQLIVDLLIAMGYGDGRAEMGQAIGKSGDGGIDGIVNEDKLGLDAVYIQAKRYAPESTIGSPDLQAFVGSLTGENATKGVFVTTSKFSKAAYDYVKKVQQRVVLIDGKRLARLMIDHDVGVKVDKTYVLRSIDANFFGVI